MLNPLKRKNSGRKRKRAPRATGFTFVEIVVALGIGAMIIAVAAIAYGAIGRNGISRRQVNVNIGSSAMSAFYGSTNPGNVQIAVSEAPSFGAAAMADNMRGRLLEDIASASAVVCLARNAPNLSRPTNLIIPAGLDARKLVTPENFRTNLIQTNTGVYTNFSTNSLGNGSTVANNLSLYVLSSPLNATNLTVAAIYESDWLTVTNAPAGVYASVRRYVGNTMTDYYHVFYPGATHNPTNRPAAAFFTKSDTTTGDPRYRLAENRPFYFVWWPDPMNQTNGSQYPSEATIPPGARGDYMLQAGATSYFFVIPAFPPL